MEQFLESVIRNLVPPDRLVTVPIRASIIRNRACNAFIFPDGRVYIHTGMLAVMENEAQLATILGHESIHVLNHHMIRGIHDARGKTAISAVVGAMTGNVLGVGPEDSIETLNMMNVDGAGKFARDNIIADIATAADMPAVLLKNESFVSGFGEGTEDSKAVAQYVNALQEEMNPLYDFFDRIVMRRAWSEEFYATVQAKYPEYKKIGYENAFFAWANSFHAEWPSYLEEAPSEQVKTEEVKHRTLISVAEVMLNGCDPENAATVKKWVADNVNANKLMFQTPLELDWDSLATYEPPAPPGLGGADGEGGEDGNIKPPKPHGL